MVYTLLVTLLEIEPAIWRRLQVPASITLRKLHKALQAAMGWTNSHLHEFVIGAESYGPTEPWAEPTPDVRSDRAVRLADVVTTPGMEFTYLYDFGDDWTHRIVVESMRPAAAAAYHALCLDGARACPPEDSGGSHGYAHLLSALADPDHEEHADLEGWAGDFDPEAFDLGATNSRLRKIRF